VKHQANRVELDNFWAPLRKDAKSGRPLPPPRATTLRPGKRPRPISPLPDPVGQWWKDTQAARRQKQQTRQPETDHETAPMHVAQGKKRLMSPSACVNFHPFTETLQKWEEGVPVDCGEDWTVEQIEAAIQQGPHKSALNSEAIALIEEDVAYQVRAGYAQVVDWATLRKRLPPQLKVSPLAVVPQLNRRGRMILDLSFPVLRQSGGKGRKRRGERDILKKSVNDSTVRLAPDAPVKELGNVLSRLLRFMQEVPPEEEIHFAKIDLADGYWRMIVEEESRWNFAYVLPGPVDAPIRLVIPSALQMGWNESPAYFCAATETTRDIAQAWIDQDKQLDEHAMEATTYPTTDPRIQTSKGEEFQMSAVYVDDFLLAAVQNTEQTLLQRTMRATLHAIHSVFRPPSASDPPGTKDPISEKKLQKGDARWNPVKEVLGYELNGRDRTVKLPAPKADALLKELRKALRKQRLPLKRFRSLVGRLQHAARILPSTKAFFTPMNDALRGLPQFIGLSRHGEVREALLDAGVLIQELAQRPTHVSELVAGNFDYVGFCDASAFGAGGVWFSGDKPLRPAVWRVEFPPDITSQVVSDSNPTGALTNSDLELAGVLLHYLALEQVVPDLQHVRVAIGCDNTPAVAWTTRMATRASSPIAFRLLRGLAMRQRVTQAAPPETFHTEGERNVLADVASRIIASLTNVTNPLAFLAYYNARFPLPQSPSWVLVTLDSALCSNVISTLRGRRLELRRWTTSREKRGGQIGAATPWVQTPIPTSAVWTNQAGKACSLPLPPEFALASTEKVGKLAINRSKKRFVTWRKPSNWVGTTTQGEPTAPKTSTCLSDTC
jgi:hypothetical protein